MPAPFRKACRNCVKSKRRCDLGQPRCYRCKARSLDCHYGDHSPAAASKDYTKPTGTDSNRPLSPALDDVPAAEASTAEYAATVDLNAQLLTGSAAEELLPSFPDFDLDWTEAMSDVESLTVPDVLDRPPETRLMAGEIYQARVIYAIKRMKSYPACLVRRGSAPFIHANLYDHSLPEAMQGALCCCSLYLGKNEANESLVWRTVNGNVSRLLLTAGQQPTWSSPVEHLAAVQTLLLFQIIRLLDGDIRQRANAERDDPILLDWTQQLKAAHATPLRTSIGLAHPGSWRDYVFAESVRRTIALSLTLSGLYSYLRDGWYRSHPDFLSLSFFAQKALWTASSNMQWQMALRKFNALPVRYSKIDEDLRGVGPSDADEFGVLLFVLQKGMDACAEWLGDCDFENYGLDVEMTNEEVLSPLQYIQAIRNL